MNKYRVATERKKKLLQTPVFLILYYFILFLFFFFQTLQTLNLTLYNRMQSRNLKFHKNPLKSSEKKDLFLLLTLDSFEKAVLTKYY